MSILTSPMVYGAVAIIVIVLALLACLFAPVKMLIDAIRDDHRADEQEFEGSFPVNAQWPSNSLSREYGKEFEPRGM